jgi:hypothetical protein
MKVFYLHIPKTGGQTLATRLASAFPIGRSDILGADLNYPRGVGELKRMMEEMDFVERHVAGPILKDVDSLDILITVREPVSQIVSNYLHIRREPGLPLHRAAALLAPREFLAKFGDFLANHQSRYLASAFFDPDIDPSPLRTLSAQIFAALARVRWVVPTESIDEFMTFWALDTRTNVPTTELYVNVTKKDVRHQDLLELVRGMPELYSLDLLLWHAARQRYFEYRHRLLGSVLPFDSPNNTSRACSSEGGGIWLRSGWYPPELGNPIGPTWWAGPGQYSEVSYSRRAEQRYLKFSVAVLCGLTPFDIWALGPDKLLRLSTKVNQQADSLWDYCIDLEGLPLQGCLYLWVTEVWAPAMLDPSSMDLNRKSFATCGWQFADAVFVNDEDRSLSGVAANDNSGSNGAEV